MVLVRVRVSRVSRVSKDMVMVRVRAGPLF